YASPKGCLLFARVQGEAAGSVALRPLEDNIGEVKRLYVRPGFRGYGLGRRLFGDIVAFARAAGYASLRLDTIRGLMADAENPYQSVGFRECAAYYENPIEGAVYYELNFPQEPGRD
ncbi:MAG: GNAT family N-acetyltransferase, partial [Pseudomonadota bacterium]|nr:GNAT family N-acetyltransferase [Pseudomonadota bacterium]